MRGGRRGTPSPAGRSFGAFPVDMAEAGRRYRHVLLEEAACDGCGRHFWIVVVGLSGGPSEKQDWRLLETQGVVRHLETPFFNTVHSGLRASVPHRMGDRLVLPARRSSPNRRRKTDSVALRRRRGKGGATHRWPRQAPGNAARPPPRCAFALHPKATAGARAAHALQLFELLEKR